MKDQGPNPSGLCRCGCGGVTPIAKRSETKRGYVKGQPHKFLPHHNSLTSKKGSSAVAWKGGRSNASRGYININQPGHPRAKNGNQVHEHILIAEKALGKYLPPKAVVHHHTPEQLVICQDQAYHKFIHQRTNALRACGRANWRKCMYCHQYDDPENLRFVGHAIYHDRNMCPAFGGRK